MLRCMYGRPTAVVAGVVLTFVAIAHANIAFVNVALSVAAFPCFFYRPL